MRRICSNTNESKPVYIYIFFFCMVTFDMCQFDIQDDRKKMQKNVSKNEKMYKMSLMKKSSTFTLRTFLSCNTFSF